MDIRKLRRPAHSTVVAYLALALAMSGTAVAATGGTFLLGKANSAGRTTSLVNHGTGAALRLTAHNLTTPPLTVGKNRTRIRNLNADFLDGVTSGRLQRRVAGTCGNGSATGPSGSVAGWGAVRASSGPSSTPTVRWRAPPLA